MDSKLQKIFDDYAVHKVWYESQQIERRRRLEKLCRNEYIRGFKKAIEVVEALASEDIKPVDLLILLRHGLEKLESKDGQNESRR